MKLDNFYHFEYLGYCFHLYCYIHNVLAKVSFGLLQGIHVELLSLHGTLNWALYWIKMVDGCNLFTITRYKCWNCLQISLRNYLSSVRWNCWKFSRQDIWILLHAAILCQLFFFFFFFFFTWSEGFNIVKHLKKTVCPKWNAVWQSLMNTHLYIRNKFIETFYPIVPKY